MDIQPQRLLNDLHELRTLTGDEHGARRVAWTPTWQRARAWFVAKLDDLPVEQHVDAAGNLWVTLRGDSPRAMLLGGHLNSVPNGGWLDGCLGTLGAVEVLRTITETYGGRPPFTVRLVDLGR